MWLKINASSLVHAELYFTQTTKHTNFFVGRRKIEIERTWNRRFYRRVIIIDDLIDEEFWCRMAVSQINLIARSGRAVQNKELVLMKNCACNF